jgi:hypothetical protein
MTTVQFLHRIGRRARGGDFTKLSLSEKTDLLQAGNSALQKCYDRLPVYFKELTEGFLLPAPRQVTVDVTRGSNKLSSDVFAPSEFGRSVVLEGDGAWNQAVGTDTLVQPYNGQTGTVNAVVYGDAFYSERYPFDRLIGNPRFADVSSSPLLRSELMRGSYASLFSHTTGRPQCFWTQALGNSQGNEPIMCMRFAPAPDASYPLTWRIGFWPKRLLLSDFTIATTLPVPDQFLEAALIPLALYDLVTTPAWDKGGDEDKIAERAEKGEQFLAHQPAQVGSPDNRIFTPIGF